MYHASVPCPFHDNLLFVFSCTTTLVPGGAIVVALKLNLPNISAYAEREGLRLADLNKLMVLLQCGRSRSHYLEGNFGSQVYNSGIRWFLYVRMARSAALRRYIYGCTSWYSTWAPLNIVSVSLEHSLLRMCIFGALLWALSRS